MGQGDPPEQTGVGWLGAEDDEPKNDVVVVFIPSKTREDQPIDHVYWRDEAIRVMSHVFEGGATAMEGTGGWLDKEHGGQVQIEAVSIVVSFIAEGEWDEEAALQLRRFLHRMGREANQGEVAVYAKGQLRRIRRYDND